MKTSLYIAGTPHTEKCGREVFESAQHFGKVAARKGLVLVTSYTTGFPLWVAKGYQIEREEMVKEGMSTDACCVIAFSPAKNKEEHEKEFKLPLEHVDIVLYTAFGQAGSDLLASRSSDIVVVGCDALTVVSSLVGPLEEGKIIGVLDGSWKQTDAYGLDKVIHDRDPGRLLDQLISKL